jgi:hypothetical protein
LLDIKRRTQASLNKNVSLLKEISTNILLEYIVPAKDFSFKEFNNDYNQKDLNPRKGGFIDLKTKLSLFTFCP